MLPVCTHIESMKLLLGCQVLSSDETLNDLKSAFCKLCTCLHDHNAVSNLQESQYDSVSWAEGLLYLM